MAPSPKPEAWIRQYMHALRLRVIKAVSNEKIAGIRTQKRLLRRSQERLTQTLQDCRWITKRGPLSIAAARERLDIVCARSGIVLRCEADAVARYVQHVDALCREHAVIVADERPLPGTNAYALAHLRTVEIPAITSPDGYLAALHEIGHIVHPCGPTHVRVPRGNNAIGTLCVQCELLAWEWVARTAVDWTPEMHVQAARSLRTYEPYGTPAEAIEIRQWCGTIGFARQRLTRSTGDRP